MKRLTVLILAICLLVTPAALADRTISVQGTGVIRTTPDVAVISLGAEAYGEDVSSIQKSVNESINNIIDTLTNEFDIPQESIQTGNYSIYRRYYDDYGNPSREYVATCMLNVTVTDIDKAGAVIDAAFTAGANTMGSVTFSVRDQSTLADTALSLAVENAIHRARVIAAAAGLTLDDIPTVITEGIDNGYVTNTYRSSMTEDAAAGASSKIMGGTVEISATVTVTYIIKE